MEISQLEAFVAVVEEKSFSRASAMHSAARGCIGVPAASRNGE